MRTNVLYYLIWEQSAQERRSLGKQGLGYGPLRSYASANGERVRTKTVRAMGEGLYLTVNSILSMRKVARPRGRSIDVTQLAYDVTEKFENIIYR